MNQIQVTNKSLEENPAIAFTGFPTKKRAIESPFLQILMSNEKIEPTQDPIVKPNEDPIFSSHSWNDVKDSEIQETSSEELEPIRNEEKSPDETLEEKKKSSKQESNELGSWIDRILLDAALVIEKKTTKVELPASDPNQKVDSKDKKNLDPKLVVESKQLTQENKQDTQAKVVNSKESHAKESPETIAKFENKILTSRDILEKLQTEIQKDSGKKEISSTDVRDIELNSKKPSPKDEKAEHNTVINKDKLTEEKKEAVVTESKKQPIKSQEEISQTINKKEELSEKLDRSEKMEQARDSSKWEIRQERVKADTLTQQNQNQTQNQANQKEVLATSGSSGFQNPTHSDSGREGMGEGQRSEMIRSLTARKNESTVGSSHKLNQEEMKANLDRLVQKAKIQIINQGKSSAEIRMNPQDLGRMILKISVNKDKVEGKILVDSEAVKSVLQADLNNLREELRNQGLSLESLSIDVDLDSDRNFAERKEGFRFDENSSKVDKKDLPSSYDDIPKYKNSDSLLDVVA
jgi:flagellar hook-length control protein FliK